MVAFKDAASTWEYKVGSEPDYTYGICDNDDADLGNFFSRPLKIRSYNWGTGTTLFEKFNPWDDYFTNPRVINRISNFNLLRAKLHLKFIINGNGFHYGRIIASYVPFLRDDKFTVDRAFFIQDVIQASQRPHVYLDPTLSQGGDLVLPFFWDENAMNIPNEEWGNMGEIIMHTMQTLKHANGANDSVTISVFAWAEEVSLAVPTSAEPGAIVPQAEDEYGKGPISRPASVIAKAAGALRTAPIIGPYARATEIAASATSAVATTFGYSRPAILDDIVPYRPTVMGNMANTNMPDSTTKLTTDCKQELTIDSRTVGLSGTDEMSVNSIACRESYITQFPWTVSAAPESPLFQIEVNPQVWDFVPTTTLDEIHMPACAFATLPFGYWRGSMKYRFQIVSSAYHKGRLKLVYEPYAFGSNEYNTNYTYIVDIAEDKDFTVNIGWGSEHPWCQVISPGRGPSTGVPPFKAGPTLLSNPPGRRANGILRVYVVNELTIPNSSINNDISINVFVSAGEDLCVANPTNAINDYSFFNEPPIVAQSEDEMQASDADATDEPSKPLDQELDHTMLKRQDNATAYDHIFFGETVVSFRALLKRYNRAFYTFFTVGTPGNYLITDTRRSFPPYKGYALEALSTVPLGQYNYAVMTLLNYLTPAFCGWRGGLRYKVNMTTNNASANYVGSTVTRLPASGLGVSQSIVEIDFDNPNVAQQILADTGTIATSAGATATNMGTVPCLEFEMPYAIAKRFSPARQSNVTSAYPIPVLWDDEDIPFQIQSIMRMTGGQSTIHDYHVAAAEDFSLFFFVGAPIMYYGVPTPA